MFWITATPAEVPAPQHLDDLQFITEQLPPLHFIDPRGQKTGSMIEIVEWLLREVGARQQRRDIRFMPWARAYLKLQQQNNIVLFTTSYLTERQALFKWVGPLMPYTNILIAKKSRPLPRHPDGDLHRYRIGAVRDTMDQLAVMERGVTKEQMTLVTLPIQLIQMLNRDRIDAFAYSAEIGKYLILQEGGDPNDYQFGVELKQVQLYLALNPAVPDQLVRQLQQGLERIKQAPEYQAIIQRYQQATPALTSDN